MIIQTILLDPFRPTPSIRLLIGCTSRAPPACYPVAGSGLPSRRSDSRASPGHAAARTSRGTCRAASRGASATTATSSSGPITGKNSGSRSIGHSSHNPASATATLARRGTLGSARNRRMVVTQSGTKLARLRSSQAGGGGPKAAGAPRCPPSARRPAAARATSHSYPTPRHRRVVQQPPCRLLPAGQTVALRWPGQEHRGQMSLSMSFHPALLGPTGAHSLDDPPEASCKDSTRQHAVDDPLLSCTCCPARSALLRRDLLATARPPLPPSRPTREAGSTSRPHPVTDPTR
jgi:hypothetical protein